MILKLKTISAFLALVPLYGVFATRHIHPGGNKDNCLGVFMFSNYLQTQMTVVPCATTRSAVIEWDIVPGSNRYVSLSDFNYCLAPQTPQGGNGVLVQAEPCHPGIPRQQWYLTDDNRIAMTGGTMCLDWQDGKRFIQTWRCTDKNMNQVFTTTDLRIPLPTRDCINGKQEIVFPAKNVNLTALAAKNGGKFRFQYCSGLSRSSWTRNIQAFLIDQVGDLDDRILVEQVANNGSTYTLDLEVNVPFEHSQPPGRYLLEVLETYESNFNPLKATRKSIDVLV